MKGKASSEPASSGRSEIDEFLQQAVIAEPSLARVEALLQLTLRLAIVAPDDVVSLLDQCAEVGCQLDVLSQFLEDRR